MGAMKTQCILLALSPQERLTFFPEDVFQRLQQCGARITELAFPFPEGRAWKDLLEGSGGTILVSCWNTPPLPDELRIGPGGLSYVCHLGGTVRRLVPHALLERGLLVTNWGRTSSRVVAECALLMILAALRKVNESAMHMHGEGGWKSPDHMVRSLFGRSVGLHGFGAISQSLVPLLAPFGVCIQTFSPHVPDSLLEEFCVARAGSLEELFGGNEIIVELAGATPANQNIVKEHHLRLIPEGGCFINIGRGATVDEEALTRVAREGRLQIALDVYAHEPLPPDSPLRGLHNVLLLPHIGGPTPDRYRDCGEFAVENIARFLAGHETVARVTPRSYEMAT